MLALTALLALCLMPCAPLAFAPEAPKVVHDWPEYRGPNGQFGDTSKVPLADSMTAMTPLWDSEEKGIGFGKSHSGYGRDISYGGGLGPSGIGSPIVAGGLVIMSCFTPLGRRPEAIAPLNTNIRPPIKGQQRDVLGDEVTGSILFPDHARLEASGRERSA